MGAAAVPIAIGLGAVGTGIAAFGQMEAGRAAGSAAQASAEAAASQARYQAAIADINRETALRNRQIAEINATYVESASAAEQEDRGRSIRQTIGAQRAAMAANGLLLDSGTAADLQEDTVTLGNLGVRRIAESGAREASSFRIEGINAMDEARAATLRGEAYRATATNALAAGRFEARSARRAAAISAAGTLLGGAASGTGRYADMQRSGAVSNVRIVP